MSIARDQVERLSFMKKEFSRAIDEAIAALVEIEVRSQSQEWWDYAEENDYDVDELMILAADRLDYMEQHYNDAYVSLYLDDIAYNDLEDIL